MRYLLTFFILSACLLGWAQVIDSTTISPKSNILTTDTVTIFVYTSYPVSSCAGSAGWAFQLNNIDANALHCQDTNKVPCTDIDTIILYPPLSTGTRRFTFTLNSGFGIPTCTPGWLPNDYDTLYFNVSRPPPPPARDTNPQISDIVGDSICENDTLGPLQFIVNDEDLKSALVWATSDNQALVPDANIFMQGNGNARDVSVVPLPNQTGSANIQITIEDTAGQRDSTIFQIDVKSCPVIGGINEQETTQFTIHPNPSNGMLNVTLDKEMNDIEIVLMNMEGKSILRQHFDSGRDLTLTLPDETGAYLISIYAGGKLIGSERILRL